LALPASLPCINSLRVLANQPTNTSKSQHHGNGGEGGRGRQEGPRGGPKDGGVAAGGVRASAGGRDRGGLRARHGVHVDLPAQEGGAPLQAGEQARESYDVEVTGYVQAKRIKKLKGVKAKELMLWPPVNEITVDDPPTGKIHFKSLAGVTKTFPVEAFAAGQ
jgi:hypothetical protein